jgi:hypothetical protein
MPTFTYNDTTPGIRDKLRTIIGDNDGDDYIFSNEELDIFLTRNGNGLERSAADACRAIAFSATKQAVIVKLLDTQIDRSEIPRIYLQMANTFERQERNVPIEYWDSFAYDVDCIGQDRSEYVGDDE